MARVNSFRVLLCGLTSLTTGLIWFVLSAISLAWVGRSFVETLLDGRKYIRTGTWLFLGVDIAMGIWAIWLYVAIRPRYGRGAKTAVIVGFAWWFIKSLQSAKWVGLGLVSLPLQTVIGPLLATLFAAIIATVVGVWLYERTMSSETPANSA
jgi:hypothetical protein